MFNRTDDEWDAIVSDTVEILIVQARLHRLSSYSDLNAALHRRGHRAFDFGAQSDRAAMGAVLGDVVNRTIGDTRIMLSSFVVYIDRNDAGQGFYALAVQLGLLASTATAEDKLAFWSNQVNRVHQQYARPRRVPRP